MPKMQSWDARRLMERSRAVKCPDIRAYLAGSKKVQQVLARPGVLERFFPDQPQAVQQIRAAFADLYTIHGEKKDTIFSFINGLAAAERFVSKPHKTVCGVCAGLYVMLGAWGLVDFDSKLILASVSHWSLGGGVKGIGWWLFLMLVFSLFSYRQGKDMVINECVGHLLRTKSSGQSDGGVAAGVTVLDNPLLF
uniref:Glutathione synthetase n=1 Tax=Maylandia zebra TaxID=106582 RepID=A0A3P9C947_9CICH